ncbi:MAG: protease HtpX [Bdellovibrionales bacterium]|nr:protease HtpX [Bdellovibrionales bacterium]
MFAIAKRVFFFTIVNILVIATLSITAHLLTTFFGIDFSGYTGLLIFCAIFGMGGAFISLAMSKMMAKWMFGLRIIEPRTTDPVGRQIVEVVHDLSRKARLSKMPEVAVYESEEVNAFATGPSKNNSLVAVSTGLLRRMNKDQVEGVLGHEVAHIANGDMVTMTLIQGIINALVMFAARIIAGIIASQVEERSRHTIHFLLVIVLQILLGFLGMIVVNGFSRYREYRADAGGSRLAGREKMIGALRALANTDELVEADHPSMASLKIAGGRGNLMAKLFSTHPPIEDRILRLESAVRS